MADTVTVQTIADVAGVKHVAKMTNLSDGTGESLVTNDSPVPSDKPVNFVTCFTPATSAIVCTVTVSAII